MGEGNWQRCSRLMSRLFDTSSCPFESCSFNGEYQPQLPSSFMGFSYLYDRTAAIGLIDGTPRQFGSQEMSRADIELAGSAICGLDATATATKFATTQDAAKSFNYCGDVAYVASLLGALGFDHRTKLTMTNKIKEVELVWTLGAMIGKSAELAAGGITFGGFVSVALALATVAALCSFLRHMSARNGYRIPDSRDK